MPIPYNYVIYNRHSNNKFWENARSAGEAYIKNNTSSITSLKELPYEQAGSNLLNMANIERNKEIALIQKVFPDFKYSKDNIKNFLRTFNELLVGKEQFENSKKRLSEALQDKNQSYDNRAPTMASWFSSYLATELTKGFNGYVNSQLGSLVKVPFSSFAASFDKIIDNAIDRAFQKTFSDFEQKEGKELYGSSEQYKGLYEAYQQMKGISSSFREMIKSKLNLNNLQQEILNNTNLLIQKSKNKSKRGMRDIIKNSTNINTTQRGIGGSVEEYIRMLMRDMSVTISNKGGAVMKGEKMKTDSVTIYNFNTEITTDFQQLAELMAQSILPKTLFEAERQMENFYQAHLANLKDTFIVYDSTKSYSMGENFSKFGFGNGTQTLENVGKALDNSFQDLILAGYNSSKGAVLENSRDSIIEQIKLKVVEAMAKLLFDDWYSVGVPQISGTQAIHIFSLDGIEIPLSVLLEATGDALIDIGRNYKAYFNVSISLPKEIMYPNTITPEDMGVEHLHNSDIVQAWNNQLEETKRNSKITTYFLLNFKKQIKKWIDF